MSGEKVPIVFFPRFTPIVGDEGFQTTPIDMLGFQSFSMTYWRGDIQNGGTVAFAIEQSADLTTWAELDTTPDPIAPTVDSAYEVAAAPTQRYVRATASLSASDGMLTLWAVGYAVKTQM